MFSFKPANANEHANQVEEARRLGLDASAHFIGVAAENLAEFTEPTQALHRDPAAK